MNNLRKLMDSAIRGWFHEKRRNGEHASYELFLAEMVPTLDEFNKMHNATYYTKRDRMDMLLEDLTLPGEEWQPVEGASRYMISSLGRVWSNYYGAGMMKPQLNGKKYPAVLLRLDDGRYKRCLIHRLVAKAFIPNPRGLATVDHIDEDHFNNRVENLRWMSEIENREAYMANHGIEYRTRRSRKREGTANLFGRLPK